MALGHVAVAILGHFDCPICFELMSDALVTSCGHSFCKECAPQCCVGKLCPSCRTPITALGPNYFIRELVAAVSDAVVTHQQPPAPPAPATPPQRPAPQMDGLEMLDKMGFPEHIGPAALRRCGYRAEAAVELALQMTDGIPRTPSPMVAAHQQEASAGPPPAPVSSTVCATCGQTSLPPFSLNPPGDSSPESLQRVRAVMERLKFAELPGLSESISTTSSSQLGTPDRTPPTPPCDDLQKTRVRGAIQRVRERKMRGDKGKGKEADDAIAESILPTSPAAGSLEQPIDVNDNANPSSAPTDESEDSDVESSSSADAEEIHHMMDRVAGILTRLRQNGLARMKTTGGRPVIGGQKPAHASGANRTGTDLTDAPNGD